MRFVAAFALVLSAVAGCVSRPNPGCTGPIGPDGRPLALCENVNDVPVCDLSPMATTRAHYEQNEMGMWVLRDGMRAFCNDADAVVCGNPDVLPVCLYRPPM